MKSPKIINYEIRPNKFAERKMLLSSFSRILGAFNQKYQYVGFGGLAFTDFKLFHKELNIESMYSIEKKFSIDKLYFNKPFSCINILYGPSSAELNEINLSLPSIIWLDYDDPLNMTVFNDLNIVLNRIEHGSIIVISCNRELKMPDASLNKTREMTKIELYEKYNQFVSLDELDDDCCFDLKASQTIRLMLQNQCFKLINNRNALGEELQFYPLYNILYSEYRGARMYTYGGIVLTKDFDVNQLNLSDLDFIGTNDPYEIDIPNVTYREASHLNQILNISEEEEKLLEKEIITRDDLDKYRKFYKYMPNFYDVRL